MRFSFFSCRAPCYLPGSILEGNKRQAFGFADLIDPCDDGVGSVFPQLRPGAQNARGPLSTSTGFRQYLKSNPPRNVHIFCLIAVVDFLVSL